MHSTKYKYWRSVGDFRRCAKCEDKHGQIYCLPFDTITDSPPLHAQCRCSIQWLELKQAGTATKSGLKGADWWLKMFGQLPDYYISSTEARQLGWIPALANLSVVAPGKMVTMGIYKNKNGHLPSKPGRIWHEADINYTHGFRGTDRILYSNDGLIFVSYDHYSTFVEIA